jgi:CRP/FNR family cyclic AMP-dependent transcriptional regulator
VTVGQLAPAGARRGHFRAAPRPTALLDVDPDLGAALDAERFAIARRVLQVQALGLVRGAWSVQDLLAVDDQAVGLLVLDGVIAREVLLADTVSTELLGQGDLLGLRDSGDPSLVGSRVRFQVLADARLGVLGSEVADVLRHFPEVNRALLERALARAQRLATTQAISHLNSVDRRLLVMFWHLAERWGRVTRDGVVVPLTLSHRLLGEMVGARRPTVTMALAALEREQSLRRLDDATWLLTGEPAGAPDHALDRVVPHRRRLLH